MGPNLSPGVLRRSSVDTRDSSAQMEDHVRTNSEKVAISHGETSGAASPDTPLILDFQPPGP